MKLTTLSVSAIVALLTMSGTANAGGMKDYMDHYKSKEVKIDQNKSSVVIINQTSEVIP